LGSRPLRLRPRPRGLDMHRTQPETDTSVPGASRVTTG
jgi:hypothetical protein